MKIVVVGSLNLDFIVQAKRFPKKGETLMGECSSISFGGKGANQAVCAAKLGAEVSMIGCLGNDDNGKSMLHNMKDNHVDISNIKVLDDVASGIALITIAESDNTIIIVSGANGKVTKEIIDESLHVLLEADIVLLQLEIPLPTVEYVVDVCYQNNIKTILNPAPACDLSLDMIDKVTYLTPNEIEVEQIFKEKAENVLRYYPNKLIMTAGGKGVFYYDGKTVCNVVAEKVDVVDTTGAGDAFNGAFAYSIASGSNIEQAIRFGNKIAGQTISKVGAQTSMPANSN